MEDQAADQLIGNMEKDQSVSMETSDLAPSKPSKLFLKLKISKSLKRCGQHICPVCSKGFSSGKALGGHIRIHMKGNKNGRHRKISKLHPRNIHRAKAKKRISKKTDSAKAADHGAADDLPLNDQESNDKVSCCICNKDFRSMKSLFGHMRNHPERGWRGIRPPPSDKNSCCSSVSENNEALEVDQISCATEKGSVSGSDLLKSLPRWTNTTAKRCGKFISDEIPEAAYCLMKLARGDSFDLGQSSVGYQRKYSSTDKLMIDESQSLGLANKASEEKKRGKFVLGKQMGEGKGKARLKSESDQERSVPSEGKRGDSYWPCEGKKMGKSLVKELNCDNFIDRKTMVREKKMKLNYEDATNTLENNRWFDQFQKFPMKPNEEEGDPSTMEGRYKGKIIIPSSQTPGFYPKNPSGRLLEAPLNETASNADGKHLHSKTQFPPKTASQAAEGNQVCAPKLLDFDLNEPYVVLDAEATGS